MPCQQRAEAKIEIEIFVASNVVNVPAFSIANKNRVGIVGAIIAGNAQWQAAFRSGVGRFRTRRALFVGVYFLLQSFVHNCLQMLVLWPTHGPEICLYRPKLLHSSGGT